MGVQHIPASQEYVSSHALGGTTSTSAIVLVGSSFKTSSLASRERFLASVQAEDFEAFLRSAPHVLESSLLTTCNRIELYLASDDPENTVDAVRSHLPGGRGEGGEFYVKEGVEAVNHIMRVASGLDSMVVGEEQILQQVREAGRSARMSGTARSVLSSLFDSAVNAGRRVRASYGGRDSDRSVSAFALKFALKKLGRRPRKILLIGTGKTARLAASELRGAEVYLASRRAGASLPIHKARAVSYDQLKGLSWDGDLVISATTHPGYVVRKGDLPDRKKMVLLDLGFPRNIDPAFRRSRFIELYDLDDLAEHAGSTARGAAYLTGETMVRDEAEQYNRRLVASRLSPALANMYKWAEGVRVSETQVAFNKLATLSAKERMVVEAMTRSLVGKLLAPHASFAKQPSERISQAEKLRLLESVFSPEARD